MLETTNLSISFRL